MFKFNNGQNGHDATKIICNVYGEGIIQTQKRQRWFNKFRDLRRSLKDHDDRSTKSYIDKKKLREIIDKNRQLTKGKLWSMFNLFQFSVSMHLRTIGKVKKLEK